MCSGRGELRAIYVIPWWSSSGHQRPLVLTLPCLCSPLYLQKCSRLRHCDTDWAVMGSNRSVALESTRPITNEYQQSSWGWRASGAQVRQPHGHLWADRLENVGAWTSHNFVGLHDLFLYLSTELEYAMLECASCFSILASQVSTEASSLCLEICDGSAISLSLTLSRCHSLLAASRWLQVTTPLSNCTLWRVAWKRPTKFRGHRLSSYMSMLFLILSIECHDGIYN